MRARRLLVDFGCVISLPQPTDDIARLARVAGLSVEELQARYWVYREEYDAGSTDIDYWSKTLDRDLSAEGAFVAALVGADMESWSHLNGAVLDILAGRHAAGVSLTLLSNAPLALAHTIEANPVFDIFDGLLFSARLRVNKPHPDSFRAALAAMGASADQVVFIDDREENLDAAHALGIEVIRFTTPSRLMRDLGA